MFLGASAKLLKATISFNMSVRQHGTTHWTDFHEILYLMTFRKSVEKIQVSLKSKKNKGYFTRRPIYISDTRCRENQNINFVLSFFFSKMVPFFEKIWKKFVEQGRAHKIMSHAHCLLDT